MFRRPRTAFSKCLLCETAEPQQPTANIVSHSLKPALQSLQLHAAGSTLVKQEKPFEVPELVSPRAQTVVVTAEEVAAEKCQEKTLFHERGLEKISVEAKPIPTELPTSGAKQAPSAMPTTQKREYFTQVASAASPFTFTKEKLLEGLKSKKFKNIVAITGAGISVNAGIPDFRSPKIGLYENLKEFKVKKPEDIFTLDYFLSNPSPFYQLMQKVFGLKKFMPTFSHHFIANLWNQGLLKRVYTQNVDGLERETGLPSSSIVEAHGNLWSGACVNPACKNPVSEFVVRSAISSGSVPHCDCCGGYVKPNMVFFQEDLPQDFQVNIERDLPYTDLLLVVGTSLATAPMSLLPREVPASTPRVYINKVSMHEPTSGAPKLSSFNPRRDLMLVGDCDNILAEISSILGWDHSRPAAVSPSLHSAVRAQQKPVRQVVKS